MTPEDRRRNIAQRTAEIAERQASFYAITDQQHTETNHELLPLGGARKRPSNGLPKTGGALYYTPAGGITKKKAGHP